MVVGIALDDEKKVSVTNLYKTSNRASPLICVIANHPSTRHASNCGNFSITSDILRKWRPFLVWMKSPWRQSDDRSQYLLKFLIEPMLFKMIIVLKIYCLISYHCILRIFLHVLCKQKMFFVKVIIIQASILLTAQNLLTFV